jgi:hypothetical protein
VRHALLRVGAVAAASGVTAIALFGVGRVILFGDLGIALPSFPQPTPSPIVTSSPAVLSETATPIPSSTPTPTQTPEPLPTQTAAPTPSPLALTRFGFSGRSYVGVVVPDADRTFVAPFAGRVEVVTYQFIDGEVRVGSAIATLPFYPYISVVAPDRKITYRSGMLGSVTELLTRDGTAVTAGDPLFRLLTLARSSWTTFYNSSAPYQVVVSLQSMPSGRDLDAAVYLEG